MQFDRAMIDLVREIRRQSPSELKPAIKLANPELMSELKTLYHDTHSTVVKTLIAGLFDHAGSPWKENLEQLNDTPNSTHRVYRGGHSIEPASASPVVTSVNMERSSQIRQRIYRGRPID